MTSYSLLINFCLALVLLINSNSCGNTRQSINLLNVHIEWTNEGKQTLFSATSSLQGPAVSDINNAWLGIGINNGTMMVCL